MGESTNEQRELKVGGLTPTAELEQQNVLHQPPSRFHRESRLDLLNTRDRHGGDTLASADKAEAFVGRGLDSDTLRLDLQGLRQPLSHRFQVWTDLRSFGDQ